MDCPGAVETRINAVWQQGHMIPASTNSAALLATILTEQSRQLISCSGAYQPQGACVLAAGTYSATRG
jgi:hypothetical protein